MEGLTCIYTATSRASAELRLCRQGCKCALAAWAVVPVSPYRMFPLSFLFHSKGLRERSSPVYRVCGDLTSVLGTDKCVINALRGPQQSFKAELLG